MVNRPSCLSLSTCCIIKTKMNFCLVLQTLVFSSVAVVVTSCSSPVGAFPLDFSDGDVSRLASQEQEDSPDSGAPPPHPRPPPALWSCVLLLFID